MQRIRFINAPVPWKSAPAPLVKRTEWDSVESSGDDADGGVAEMADYIRGKKTYTKWDADTDNVDMDLSPEAPHVQVATSPGWFSGTKGRVLRVLANCVESVLVAEAQIVSTEGKYVFYSEIQPQASEWEG
ncbi:hypothetical protein HPB51_009070 [Rhipicephalus microplus]|uniref:Uncharacterized protein n=1 Tax=Rhipicephalus microplus TaxID=6941 RepID=A0A9J6EZ90_RHIMP|nr:hypothetical protein HPB51_009070 [Rhipicephalus microplus]